MTSSKLFLYLCLSFIGGIFLSSVFTLHLFQKGAGLILGLILISVFWKYQKFVVFGFCLLFLVAGIWRHQGVELRNMPPMASLASGGKSELRSFNDTGEAIALIGIVASEPDIKEKSSQLIIEIQNINGLRVKEKILVATWRYPEYKYGDKLKITGELKTPSEDIEGFNYKDYLQKEGIYSIMGFPKIELVGQGFGNPVMKILFSFKHKFKETARNFISPPQEGILEALIFGDEENISKEWKEKLNFTGTRHITAVSGMNITIIASLLLSLALSFGLWRQQAFYSSIFLLVLYILMIGAPASAIRAGIMGGILLLAQYFGRMSQASRAVVFASTFMLAANPLLLRLDVGFQLSFLAILGIIYLQPIFADFFKKIPNSKFLPLKATFSTTLSAQVFTLPILIYNFGFISLVSPLTNILIVPILAPITILIFIFGLTGMIFPPVGLLLSWPVWLFLTYITKIIDIFSKIPFVSLTLKNISWVWLIIFYIILGFLVWRTRRKGFLNIV